MGTLRIVIVGAGVSGLAAAHRLLELCLAAGIVPNLRVLEAGPRPGGLVRTRRENGFLWEEGPDSFITDKPWAFDLCRRLSLDQELIGTDPNFRRSWVLWDGRLHAVPEGFYLLAPSRALPFARSSLFTLRGKLRMAAELFVPPRRGGGDESLADFVRRRFGREALERVAQPMAAGVYAADPETLSLPAAFPQFAAMEGWGGVIGALRRRGTPGSRGRIGAGSASGPRYGLFMTLKSGLSALVEALAARVSVDRLTTLAPAESLRREGGAWRVRAAGRDWEADAVCLALPAPQAAQLLRGVDEPLADALAGVPHGDSGVLHLAYDRGAVDHPLDGFGFVVPAAQRRFFTGCSFSSVKFPARAPEGKVLFRLFLPDLPPMAEEEAARRAHKDLAEILSIRREPVFSALARHGASMPRYTLGHLDRVRAAEDRLRALPELFLAGNGLKGIGLPDCVRSGEEAAERIFSRLVLERGR